MREHVERSTRYPLHFRNKPCQAVIDELRSRNAPLA